MNKFHRINFVIGLFLLSVGFNGCYYGYNDKSERNKVFAPNMYESLPLEPYSQTVEDNGGTETAKNDIFDNGLSMQDAPEGTVPRTYEAWYKSEEYVPFHYPNTPEAYDSAGIHFNDSPLDNSLRNDDPYNCTELTFEKGKTHYERFCIMCHGPNGMGQGNLVTSGVFAGVPAYNDDAHKNLPPGKMFFSITYGKGVMGGYAYQLTPKERWEVICYIQEFQKVGNSGAQANINSSSTSTQDKLISKANTSTEKDQVTSSTSEKAVASSR